MNAADEMLAAVQADHLARIVELLEEDAALVDARNEAGDSAILLAIYYGHQDAAQILLSKGAALNIWEAAAVGNAARVAEHLNADRALVHAVSHDGFTPLQLAVFFGHTEAVQLLLAKGANPNVISQNQTFARGVPILQSAVVRGKIDIVETLLAHGADVNIRNTEGMTALHAAAFNGNVEIVRLLLANGADTKVKTNDGETAREIAEKKGNAQVAELLNNWENHAL